MQSGPTTTPMMPIISQQAYQAQPMMIAGAAAPPGVGGPPIMVAAGGVGGGVPPGQPVLVNGGPVPMMPGTFPSFPGPHNDPVTGIGQTAGDVAAMCMMDPELNAPQDFKPFDDNPSRMYYVRQLDGNYCAMPRATIDSFGKEGVRWYVKDDGVFYAVRLEG